MSVIVPRTFDEHVQALGVPHRAKNSFWHLVLSGAAALPAVRRGLTSDNKEIRVGCTKVMDHLVDEESWPELIAMLDDASSTVRWNALHALACDRCKETTCRPEKADLLPRAMQALALDPAPFVRAIAVEVVARFVYDDANAEAAIITARDCDPDRGVRKKASWFAPGGSIYEKKKPKVRRS